MRMSEVDIQIVRGGIQCKYSSKLCCSFCIRTVHPDINKSSRKLDISFNMATEAVLRVSMHGHAVFLWIYCNSFQSLPSLFQAGRQEALACIEKGTFKVCNRRHVSTAFPVLCQAEWGNYSFHELFFLVLLLIDVCVCVDVCADVCVWVYVNITI